MKKISFAKGLIAASLATVCVCGLAACSPAADSKKPTYTGGVAATVNGVEIPEDEVTAAIENARASMGLTDEESWGQYLASADMTPESIREDIIDSLVTQEVIKQKAEERGVSVSDEEVESYVEAMSSRYDSEEAWQKALEGAGMTEDEYRDALRVSLLTNALQQSFQDEAVASDEEMLSYAQMYGSYYNGAKRSSHVLLDAGDTATATQLLDDLRSGKITIEDAAARYSKDTGSAGNGGDVGWDKLTSFVPEYQEALTNLSKGQFSDLVTSDYGIHIILCTDEFTAPAQVTSLDQLPAEFQESIRTMATSSAVNTAYEAWLTEQKDACDIVINPMPEGLPYWVDVEQYKTSDAETAQDVPITVEGEGVTVEGADGTTVVEGEEVAVEEAEVTDNGDGTHTHADGTVHENGAEGEQPAAEGDAGTAEQTPIQPR